MSIHQIKKILLLITIFTVVDTCRSLPIKNQEQQNEFRPPQLRRQNAYRGRRHRVRHSFPINTRALNALQESSIAQSHHPVTGTVRGVISPQLTSISGETTHQRRHSRSARPTTPLAADPATAPTTPRSDPPTAPTTPQSTLPTPHASPAPASREPSFPGR